MSVGQSTNGLLTPQMEKDNYHLLRRHDVIEGFLLHDNLNVPMHSFPYKKEFIKNRPT